MRAIDFKLDANLHACTVPITSLPLCQLLLMNDARFPWLVLVPRYAGAVEMIDLPMDVEQQLWREIHDVAGVLRKAVACDKLNIGALGNITRQLHVHVVARTQSDAAWPGPVWGHGTAQAYETSALQVRIETLKQLLPG